MAPTRQYVQAARAVLRELDLAERRFEGDVVETGLELPVIGTAEQHEAVSVLDPVHPKAAGEHVPGIKCRRATVGHIGGRGSSSGQRFDSSCSHHPCPHSEPRRAFLGARARAD